MADLNNNPIVEQKEEDTIDLKSLIVKYLYYWQWFVLSVVVCMIGAFLYLRYATKQYDITASIIFKEEKDKGKSGLGAELMGLQNFGFSATNNVNNELEILKSKSLVKKTVLSMGAEYDYVVKGRVISSHLFYNQPFKISVSDSSLNALYSSFSLTADIKENGELKLKWINPDTRKEKQTIVKSLPAIVNSPIGPISFVQGDLKDWENFKGERVFLTINSPIERAKSLLGNIDISLTDKMSSVAVLHFKSIDKRWGEDFVNKLIKTYNDESRFDKNIVAQKTEEFINDRLGIIGRELGDTEKQLESTKRSAGLTTMEDLQTVVRGRAEIDQQLVKINTQLKIMEYLKDYVHKNVNQVIPSNVGLEDMSLTELITQYNKVLIERNKLARSSSENSPLVIQQTEDLAHLRNDVLDAINSAYRGLVITERGISAQARKFSDKISSAPTQERLLVDINRQQEIKAQLFLMLMQKREENSISMAATADNAKIIDDALASTKPVSPKKKIIYLAALLLGLIIPMVVIFIRDFFRVKLESRAEAEKLSKMSVLGDVPFDENVIDDSIQVKQNNNNIMAEVFRTLRTNLQFTLEPEDKIIIITSTTSGEGKSLVSGNLAVSMALLGKKVALIGMDIRNPQLHNVFKFKNPAKGLTNLIAENSVDYQQHMIIPNETSNLHILNAGMIPPNPAELLDRPGLKKLLEKLREDYDYVIIDSAPVGLVVDTLIVAKYADATIYVCRENYTDKNAFTLINELYLDHKFNKPGLVVNGVDITNKRSYGYGKKYGYGYGYGHNHTARNKKRKGFFQKLFKR